MPPSTRRAQAWNTTLYPSDGPGFVQKLSGHLAPSLTPGGAAASTAAMVYYTNGFTMETVHQRSWHMVKANGGLEPHPNVSYAFYSDLWGRAASRACRAVSAAPPLATPPCSVHGGGHFWL